MKFRAPLVLGSGKYASSRCEMGSVTDARCAWLGTNTELTAGAICLKPSYDAKKNVRLCRSGPPNRLPNSFRLSAFFGPASLLVKKSAAVRTVLRRYSKASP